MKKLIEQTLDLLNTNTKWQKRYKDYLKDIFKNENKSTKGFRKPEGLSLYTTVSERNSKCYALRFKGQNVGKVTIDIKGGINLKCLVSNDTKTHGIVKCPMSYLDNDDWKSPKASEFRSYFKKLSEETKIKSPEHEVENALLKEFRKQNGNDKTLRNIQPILLHGCFFQMPTPLKASTHIPTYAEENGGGIDILARIKTPNGHNRLCVIEIKDENKKESQRDAMSQAVIYTTFISKLLQTQPDWWEFFMGHKTKRNRNSNVLDKHDIEVATIMPTGNTETFEDETFEIQTGMTLHCHSLYYNPDKFKSKHTFDFSGTFLKEVKK